MTQLRDIPQAEYDAAAETLVASLDGPLDLEAYRSVHLLQKAAGAAREFESRDALEHFGLSWMQFEVLWNIWIFGESEAGWVARAAMVSRSGLTTLFARLEERGLILRRVDPEDRRKSLVSLSDEGSALMCDLFGRLNRANTSFSSALNTDQRQQLMELLGMLLSGPYAQADTA